MLKITKLLLVDGELVKNLHNSVTNFHFRIKNTDEIINFYNKIDNKFHSTRRLLIKSFIFQPTSKKKPKFKCYSEIF